MFRKKVLGTVVLSVTACMLMAAGDFSAGQQGAPGSLYDAWKAAVEDKENGKQQGNEEETVLTLQEFCADEELDEWFAHLDEDPPVKLECIMFGEAPYSMEFTDPELILDAARAISTVTIGGVSEETPEYVADGGGSAYYFEMADGSRQGFTFELGCFRWNGGDYHDVAGYGDLLKINEELRKTGNPSYEAVYADDDGFYTEVLETWQTEWKDEDNGLGGLFIYTGREGDLPFVNISRLPGDLDSPDEDAEEIVTETAAGVAWTFGIEVTGESAAEALETGTEGLTEAFRFAAEDENGEPCVLLAVGLKAQDSRYNEDHLIRFCALWREDDTDGEKNARRALSAAIRNFYLKYMPYEKKEVQPGNTLLEFCNDDALTKWFEKAEEELPDEVTYMSDTWYMITDPDMIRQVLEALQTVRIGDVSVAHVGASGRQIFDFYDSDTGVTQSFMFFQDTFVWEDKSYDVVDWGDLAGLDLAGAAARSGNG